MKYYLLPCLLSFIALSVFGQESDKPISFTATIGTGIAMSEPAKTPFAVQFTGHYNLTKRFSAGAGTGIAVYEKAMIPVFADIKYLITSPKKFTPYARCSVGYSFAPSKDANGGFYLNPHIGIQYSIRNQMKILLAVGYDLQHLERRKEYSDSNVTVHFKEELKHHSLSIKAGLVF